MQESLTHPPADELFLYKTEMAPVDDIERIEKHLQLCRQCRDSVDKIQKEHPEPGALDLYAIGRLTGPIGSGIRLHLSHCRWCADTLGARAEKVAQVRQGLNILIGQGAASRPEHADLAAKLTKPSAPPREEDPVHAEPEASSPPPRPHKTVFDTLSLNDRLDDRANEAKLGPVEVREGSRISGFTLYVLGRKVGALQSLTQETDSTESFQTLSDAYNAVHGLLEAEDLPISIALPIARELSRVLREAVVKLSQDGKPRAFGPSYELLKMTARRFENALEDDLENVDAFPVEAEATREVQKLIDRPESVFPPQMWASLSPAAQHHWSEAARCLAYELPTATAFHALRTLESVVNLYLDRAGVPAQSRSLPDGLEQLKRYGANPKAVELAVHLTSLHCNPLQRADCFVSGDEGVDQFDLCTVAIKAFLRDMERRQLSAERN